MANLTSAFTVTGTSSSQSGGNGTVTQVTGMLGQIDVALPTTTPVISLDPAFLNSFTQLQEAVASNAAAPTSSASMARNLLINGEGSIAQRGASGSAVFSLPTTTTRYVDDMWQIQTNGTPITLSQVAGPSGARATAIQIQRTANATQITPVNYGQTLMPSRSSTLWGEFVTYSFEAKALTNMTGTLQAVIVAGTTTNPVSYLGTGFTNPVTLATLTVPVTTDWQTFSVTVNEALLPTHTQVYCGFIWTPAGTAGASDGVIISRRQLNVGTHVAPYDFKDLEAYHSECLPFYQKSYDLNVAPGTANVPAGVIRVTSYVANGYANLIFPAKMVFTPSVALWDEGGGTSGLGPNHISTKSLCLQCGADSYYQPGVDSGGGTVYNASDYSSHYVLDASPV